MIAPSKFGKPYHISPDGEWLYITDYLHKDEEEFPDWVDYRQDGSAPISLDLYAKAGLSYRLYEIKVQGRVNLKTGKYEMLEIE